MVARGKTRCLTSAAHVFLLSFLPSSFLYSVIFPLGRSFLVPIFGKYVSPQHRTNLMFSHLDCDLFSPFFRRTDDVRWLRWATTATQAAWCWLRCDVGAPRRLIECTSTVPERSIHAYEYTRSHHRWQSSVSYLSDLAVSLSYQITTWPRDLRNNVLWGCKASHISKFSLGYSCTSSRPLCGLSQVHLGGEVESSLEDISKIS
jgi:hypothetical protein